MFDQGFGDWGISVASRWLDSASGNQWIVNRTEGGYFWIVSTPTNASPYYAVGTRLIPPGHPHFPYGEPVTPDAPV